MSVIDVYTKEGLRDRNLISSIVYGKLFNQIPIREQKRIEKMISAGSKHLTEQYKVYCRAKKEIDEEPLQFINWLELEREVITENYLRYEDN